MTFRTHFIYVGTDILIITKMQILLLWNIDCGRKVSCNQSHAYSRIDT
jgi:hypothetical protein